MDYAPLEGGVEGPAFAPPFKALGMLLAAGCALWFALLLWRGDLTIASQVAWFYLGGAQLILVWTAWHIITSRTRIDADAVCQSWMWNKQVALREVSYARFMRVRGLEWIVAPRLYLRTELGRFSLIYVASPALWRECERLQQASAALRASLGRP